jgi:hypothetical protein
VLGAVGVDGHPHGRPPTEAWSRSTVALVGPPKVVLHQVDLARLGGAGVSPVPRPPGGKVSMPRERTTYQFKLVKLGGPLSGPAYKLVLKVVRTLRVRGLRHGVCRLRSYSGPLSCPPREVNWVAATLNASPRMPDMLAVRCSTFVVGIAQTTGRPVGLRPGNDEHEPLEVKPHSCIQQQGRRVRRGFSETLSATSVM